MRKSKNVNLRIKTVKEAKKIAKEYLVSIELDNVITFGLPEIDDRYGIWRVPLLSKHGDKVGELTLDAMTSLINESKSTDRKVLESRLLGRKTQSTIEKKGDNRNGDCPKISTLRNTVGFGDSEQLLFDTPNESIDLIFTSPPYFNARPEYAEYLTYEEYLFKMKKIIHQCHRVLNEGRFFIMNVSPVLIRRSNRNEASKRIAVPFDFHRIFIEEGFEFIDDIIWVKPEGAGWATGRGRRFAADRNPLQYKPVPVTEYLLVYRKKTDKLIDWHINKHPNQDAVKNSKIADGYETTNIWKIHPAFHKVHPAIFPKELAEKVILYYSFIDDVVLDPFAGTGTVGRAAVKHKRRFVLYEQDPEFMKIIKTEIHKWLMNDVHSVNWINTQPQDNLSPFLNL